MKDFFQKYKPEIDNYLKRFLSKKEKELQKTNRWGKDVSRRFAKFVDQGKTIRGSLVVISYLMNKNGKTDEVIKAAAAIELLHSSLLIHDDIMDKDILRRGLPTTFSQYEELGKKENIKSPRVFGENLAICAGDIGYFLAFEILSSLNISPRIKGGIISLYSKELVSVGLGQMQDTYLGNTTKKVKEEDILNVYLYKTARYTFSLPFATGAILAGANEKTVKKLQSLGEYLGVIFQIKDDELGIFGSQKEIGKPVGSDIKEGKRTLYTFYLLKKANQNEMRKLKNILGNGDIKAKDIRFVRTLIEKHKIDQEIDKKLEELEEKSKKLILSLESKEKYKEILLTLLAYNLRRKR